MCSSKHTPTKRAGTVATTASANTREMILGGLWGSARKMWWISSSLPYRRGVSYLGAGALGSILTSMLKTGEMEPLTEPKEPRTRLA